MKHVKLERIPLKGHPQLTERWVQDLIAQDPSLLGLGDLELRDKEGLLETRNPPQLVPRLAGFQGGRPAL